MPLFRRYGRPGLLDSVSSASIIGGSPTTISRLIGRALATEQNASGAVPSVSLATEHSSSLANQLHTLSELYAAGHISSEEFAVAKSRLFAG